MSYGKLSMSQVKQITRRGISATDRHNMRTDAEHWSTEHVNTVCTPFNKVLIGSSTGYDIKKDIDGCDMRRNSKRNPQEDIIAAEFVLAPSSEWLGSLIGQDDLKGCTPEICQKLHDNQQFQSWIAATVDALKEERCINAVLHMDETVPHVHCVCSVRMKRESKSKSEKSKRRSKKSEYVLSFSNYYGTRGQEYILASSQGKKRAALEKKYGTTYDSTQTPLGQLQTRLWEKIGKPFNMGRGEAASTTGIRGISTKEWREKQAQKKIDEESEQKIQAYRAAKNTSVQNEKKKIDAAASNDVETYRDVASKKVQHACAEIKKNCSEDVNAFKQQENKRVELEKMILYCCSETIITSNSSKNAEYIANEKAKLDNLTKTEIADYKETIEKEKQQIFEQIRKDAEDNIRKFTNEISASSSARLKKLREEKQKEEDEERENLKKQNEERIIKLRNVSYKIEEQINIRKKELTALHEEIQKKQEQNNALQIEANDAIQRKIDEISEEAKASLALIDAYKKQIYEFANKLGVTTEGLSLLNMLDVVDAHIKADGRFLTGRKMRATRYHVLSSLETAIASAEKIEVMSQAIKQIYGGNNDTKPA